MKEFNKALLFIMAAILFSGAFIFIGLNENSKSSITGYVVSEDGTVEEYNKDIDNARPIQEVEKDLSNLGFSRVRSDGIELDSTRRVVVDTKDEKEAKEIGDVAIQGMAITDMKNNRADPIFKKLEDAGFKKDYSVVIN